MGQQSVKPTVCTTTLSNLPEAPDVDCTDDLSDLGVVSGITLDFLYPPDELPKDRSLKVHLGLCIRGGDLGRLCSLRGEYRLLDGTWCLLPDPDLFVDFGEPERPAKGCCCDDLLESLSFSFLELQSLDALFSEDLDDETCFLGERLSS